MKNGYMKKDAGRKWFQVGLSLIFFCLATVSLAGENIVSTASPGDDNTIARLDQMLAPVALYPDALLAQLLVAATYPKEVGEAAKWLKANPGLEGDAAVDAAEDFDWHDSVKSLLAFPDVLLMMSSNMGWTVRLGNAFNTRREDVMERIQYLRRKARAVGNLASDEHMNVEVTENAIAIEPVSQEMVYVPRYNPTLVYGSWWWPDYTPYYWRPWHSRAYYPGYYSSGFMWGSGILFSYGRFPGHMDWHRRHVYWRSPSHHARPDRRPHSDRPAHARPDRRPHPDRPADARPDRRPHPDRPAHARPDRRPHPNRPADARPGKRPGYRPGISGTDHGRPRMRPKDAYHNRSGYGRPGNARSDIAVSTPSGQTASGLDSGHRRRGAAADRRDFSGSRASRRPDSTGSARRPAHGNRASSSARPPRSNPSGAQAKSVGARSRPARSSAAARSRPRPAMSRQAGQRSPAGRSHGSRRGGDGGKRGDSR